MKEFWEERFGEKEYIYGTKPNQFLKEQLLLLPVGKILFPAEGEGRNAVVAAEHHWDVFAYDFSENARKKAETLAAAKHLFLHYDIVSHEQASYPDDFFDVVALLYTHTPFRKQLHQNAIRWVKPGGVILIEGFSESQLNYNSGGPKDIHLLFSVAKLQEDFQDVSEKNIDEAIVELDEGKYHSGTASVIRAIIKK